jgi:hypothetical protein
MEADFRSSRQQQQEQAAAAAAAAAAASAAAPAGGGYARERGAGDWANYQPPSAVLQAVAAQQQQQQQQQQYGHPPGPPAASTAPAAAQASGGGARDLPPALKARLAARGILPKQAGAGAAPANGAAAASADAGAIPLLAFAACPAVLSVAPRRCPARLAWQCCSGPSPHTQQHPRRCLPRCRRGAAPWVVPGARFAVQPALLVLPCHGGTVLDAAGRGEAARGAAPPASGSMLRLNVCKAVHQARHRLTPSVSPPHPFTHPPTHTHAPPMQPLPVGWVEGRDPASGAAYYFNTSLGGKLPRSCGSLIMPELQLCQSKACPAHHTAAQSCQGSVC